MATQMGPEHVGKLRLRLSLERAFSVYMEYSRRLGVLAYASWLGGILGKKGGLEAVERLTKAKMRTMRRWRWRKKRKQSAVDMEYWDMGYGILWGGE